MYNEYMGVLVIFPILLGILAAWVVNYLADVLPSDLKLTQPHCSKVECHQPIPWRDYLLLRPCPHCGKKRSVRTYVVIVLCLASSLYLWFATILQWAPSLGRLDYWFGFLILSYFYTVGIIDLEHRLILGPLSLAGLLLGGLAGLLVHGWQSTLIGGAAGFVIMFIFYLFGKLFTAWRARRSGEDPKQAEEALGSGDVTLVTILGLFLGWPLIWFGVLTGALIAGIISIIIVVALVIGRKYKKQAFLVFIPLGPMFILSALLIIFLPNLISSILPK